MGQEEEKKKLIVLTGPTASGKTALSVRLAEKIGGEIISADSMQVYRGMDIGSAKIRPDEMRGVPHHLIDVLDPGTGSGREDTFRFWPVEQDFISRVSSTILTLRKMTGI